MTLSGLKFLTFTIKNKYVFISSVIISKTLSSTLINKLKLNSYFLDEESAYVENLAKQINYLKNLKKVDTKTLITQKRTQKENIKNQNLLIMYIINISFLRANTMIHISDIKGNVKFFYSAGSVNLTGKSKKKRSLAVSKLISLLLRKCKFLRFASIALHLNNVNFYRNTIVKKLKKSLYIRVIKSFNHTPYNGCRKKKLRRKKYRKKFK